MILTAPSSETGEIVSLSRKKLKREAAKLFVKRRYLQFVGWRLFFVQEAVDWRLFHEQNENKILQFEREKLDLLLSR